jgi:hypothetical protein
MAAHNNRATPAVVPVTGMPKDLSLSMARFEHNARYLYRNTRKKIIANRAPSPVPWGLKRTMRVSFAQDGLKLRKTAQLLSAATLIPAEFAAAFMRKIGAASRLPPRAILSGRPALSAAPRDRPTPQRRPYSRYFGLRATHLPRRPPPRPRPSYGFPVGSPVGKRGSSGAGSSGGNGITSEVVGQPALYR